MTELQVPEQLKGAWDHALFLTYGVDIHFFENALWRQLSGQCRNKIILADGNRYLEACDNYAQSGLLRHLNQQYVAAGLFAGRAAHAKMILLTNSERGRLLVGSGNMGWQGYASGGEMFTEYEYAPDTPDSVNSFLAIREVIEALQERGYIGAEPRRRLRHLLENTPWLFRKPVGDLWPVQHNLDKSFLDHLRREVAGEAVAELWVLSPFYDKGMVALESLINNLNPSQVILLMQPSYTSVEPTVLRDILEQYPERCHVRSFSMGSETPYVHAKLYLLKLSDRALCLQGSPNLTQTAVLMTPPRGNIEIANLLTGSRDAFDHLLGGVEVGPVTTEVDELDLSYAEPYEPSHEGDDGWRLTGGEWRADRLYLSFQGSLPTSGFASLIISEGTHPIDVLARRANSLELRLPSKVAALLSSPVPVRLRWGRDDGSVLSNPIFICNRAALDAALELTDAAESLKRVGDLDLDDDDFEQLLAELDAALMIDRRSVWLLAGRTPPSTEGDDDEELRLDYIDIDYDMLRQHPKLRQYVTGARDTQEYSKSRLQLILNAITDHFEGLVSLPTAGAPIVNGMGDSEADQLETAEEREQEAEVEEKRRRTTSRRVRRLLKNFVRRYLRGIRSPDFQELAGFEVMANNYAIFSHILWRLFAKDWVEHEFIVESLLQTWRFFWGGDGQPGYYWDLNREQQSQILDILRDYNVDAELLAATYYCAQTTRYGNWTDLRFRLRDSWRETLRRSPLEVTTALLENAWANVAHLLPYQSPSPSQIVDELAELARFTTRDRFLRTLEKRLQLPLASCKFETQPVYRKYLDGRDMVDCLVMDGDSALQDKDGAIDLVRWWMQAEELDYYRVFNAVNGRMIYYDVVEGEGLYWAKDRGEDTEFGPVEPLRASWTSHIDHLRALAEDVDEQVANMQAERGASAEQLVGASARSATIGT